MKKISLVILIAGCCLITKAQKIPSWKIADVTNYYGKKSDAVYVINFWATYCKPCVTEIPYLQSISNKYERQHVKLLLVSMDLPGFYPKKIRNFAKEHNYTADIVWLDETDPNNFCREIDKSWIGTMPATLFVNAATGYKKFVGSEMTDGQFERELRNAIGKE